MYLKKLLIQHPDYYKDTSFNKPDFNKNYEGTVELFNEKGEGIKLNISPEKVSKIIEIFNVAMVEVAQEYADSLRTSLNTSLQIENKSDAEN